MGIKKILFAALIYAVMQGTAQAIIIDSWNTNEGDTGNYILTVNDDGANLDFHLTVNPWNAEALGLFIDFGAATITDTTLSNIVTAPTTGGSVVLVDYDTTSNSCGGGGCNLNGLNPVLVDPDSEWELVFRLGSQGFDNIQTFSWTIGDSGLSAAQIVAAGVRSQVLCPEGVTIPDASCTGSDKSYSGDVPAGNVPAPGPLVVMAIGLVGMLGMRGVKKLI